VNPGSNLCNGTVGVTFETNGTVTGTAITDSCLATGENVDTTPFNMKLEMNDTWNYILVNDQKWYFNEDDARADFLGASSSTTNNPPLAQDDIYLTMLVGETIKGVLTATDDVDDNLTFTATSLSSGFSGADLNSSTGAFSLTAGTVGQAQVVVAVTDIAGAVDEINVNVNIIEANSNSDSSQGNYSQSNEIMDLTAFNAAATIAIPGDTPLHSFWGIDYETGILIHDIMEFNTTSSQLIFSDNENNETVYFTPTLSSGETNASADDLNNDTAYNAANQVVSFKMLGSETNSSLLSEDLNITMPNGSIG